VPSTAWAVFESCERAIVAGVPTNRPRDDKEYHFQRWVADRIHEVGLTAPEPGRNTYPDFQLDGVPEAYEVKGITEDGRERDFDCNSALPSGEHGGREVHYVFGRYEKGATETPQVRDLALVHGSLLNAGGGYQADNTSMRVLGSYGDVLLRDRKMYVAFTPYHLLTDLQGRRTLVLPADWEVPEGFVQVGAFERVEHDKVLVGYEADLIANELRPKFEDNPNAGRVHPFRAWRTAASGDTTPVSLVKP